jgi:hypothetical protein
MSPKVINLACPTCGGKIDAGNQSGQCVCSYCGNQLQISEYEGELTLKPFVEVAKTIEHSMNFAASEMAIKRIRVELEKLHHKKQSYSLNWDNLKKIQSKRSNYKRSIIIFIGIMLGSFPLFIIAVAVDLIWLGILCVFAFVSAFFAILYTISKSIRRKMLDKDYLKLSEHIIPLEEQIFKKEKELEMHLRLVENFQDKQIQY